MITIVLLRTNVNETHERWGSFFYTRILYLIIFLFDLSDQCAFSPLISVTRTEEKRHGGGTGMYSVLGAMIINTVQHLSCPCVLDHLSSTPRLNNLAMLFCQSHIARRRSCPDRRVSAETYYYYCWKPVKLNDRYVLAASSARHTTVGVLFVQHALTAQEASTAP